MRFIVALSCLCLVDHVTLAAVTQNRGSLQLSGQSHRGVESPFDIVVPPLTHPIQSAPNEKGLAPSSGEHVSGEAKEEEQEHETHEGGEKGHGEEGEEVEDHSGTAVAICLISCIVMVVGVTHLMARGKMAMKATWRLLDNVIAIFLAVELFQFFNSVLYVNGTSRAHTILVGIFYTLFLLVGVLIASYSMRLRPVPLAMLCSGFAHVASFSSMEASFKIQDKLAAKGHIGLAMLATVVVFAVWFLLTVLLHKGAHMCLNVDEKWDERYTDVVNDCVAMATSVVWTDAMRAVISGSHAGFESAEMHHSSLDRWLMLLYCAGMFALMMITARYSNRLCNRERCSYLGWRMGMFGMSFLAMSNAWGIIMWGEWQFREDWFHQTEITGSVVFACFCAVIALFSLFIVGYYEDRHFMHPKQQSMLILGMSLVVGLSWEEVLDECIESLSEKMRITRTGIIFHFCFLILLSLILVPVYAWYVKPRVLEFEEEEEEQMEKEREGRLEVGAA